MSQEPGEPAVHGYMTEPLSFRVVKAPLRYERSTSGPVRAVDVVGADGLLGHLWASLDGTAARFVRIDDSDPAGKASLEWVQRLRAARAEEISSLEAFERFLALPEHPVAGRVVAESVRDLPSLADLT